VEGRSAAEAVNRVRNKNQQAVFALQGKIPNCHSSAGLRRALANDVVQALLNVVGPESERSPFARVLILCDADADGLHARMLLSVFFQKCLTNLLEDGVVFNVFPPLYQSVERASGQSYFGRSRVQLSNYPEGTFDTTYFKGVASMSPNVLASTCIQPESRTVLPLTST